MSSIKMEKVENFWSMLDDMAASNPESYKKFIEKTLKEGKETLKLPESHMCVKTKSSDKKDFFINFFGWQKIPEPKNDEEPIPVYGKQIQSYDNNSYINIAFNTQILKKYGKNASNKNERDMLINLAFKFIENQNQIKLNEHDFVVLTNMNCYGKLDDCITDLTNRPKPNTDNMNDLDFAREALSSLSIGQDDSKQLPDSILTKLANLSTNVSEKSSEKAEKNAKQSKVLIEEVKETLVEPKYDVFFKDDDQDNQKKFYEIKIHLPQISSMNECELNFEKDFLVLDCKLFKQLKLSFEHLKSKYDVLSDGIEAKFVKKSFLLKVKVPLIVKN